MRFPFLDSAFCYFGRNWRAPRVFCKISPFLREGEKILDIGAGGGWTGEILAIKKKAKVQLLDVEDLNLTDLPLQLYDGENIPFKSNSFDASLLLFVLHHCRAPLEVLKEAVRVTRKRIIVYEDTFSSPLERALACTSDFLSNSPLFLANPFKMSMPYNYREVEDWLLVFKGMGLKVKACRVKRHFMTKHVLFVLDT